MDYKYIIYALIVVVIILAVILKDKIKARFMGLTLDAENTGRKNKANIKGDGNKVKQGNSGKNTPANNAANVNGVNNEVEQN